MLQSSRRADAGEEGRGGAGLIARVVAGVLAAQEHVHLVERRPTFLVALPALAQQVVDLARTQRRALQDRGRRGVVAAGPRGHAAAAGPRGDPVAAAGPRSGGAGGDVVPALAVVDDLFVGEAAQRSVARARQHLPRRDAERPDVALRRETTLHTRARTCSVSKQLTHTHTHTHTRARLTALCPGLPG